MLACLKEYVKELVGQHREDVLRDMPALAHALDVGKLVKMSFTCTGSVLQMTP